MIHRVVEWTPTHGVPIQADLRMPEGRELQSAVLVAHGFKGFKDWGFFPHLSECLAEAGFGVVTFNFSHNGIGTDPERFTELERFATNTFSRELADLRGLLAETKAGRILPFVPTRIGLLGHSRGGGTAVLAAGGTPSVDALVTWAAVATFERWTREQEVEWRRRGVWTILNARTGQEMPLSVEVLEDLRENPERLDILSAAARVPCPWLVVHGAEDGTVLLEDARHLLEAGADTQPCFIPGSGHTFEAIHPFEGSTPALTHAVTNTVEHFIRHLDP